jgi:cytosine permease
MSDSAGSTIAPKPWDRGLAPNFIGLFLWVAFYDQLGRLALPLGGLPWSAAGASIAGLLCFLLFYLAPAMWGLRARVGLGEISESAFGKLGHRWGVGLLIALVQVGWFAVATSYATEFALRALVAGGFLDGSHLGSLVLGRLVLRSAVFLLTAFLWGLAFGLVGVYAVRPVAAIMNVFPVFAAFALGGSAAWAMAGLRDFQPAALGGGVAIDASAGAGRAVVTMIQVIVSFFCGAALSVPEWGAASRDARDVRLGGLVGVFCGAAILAILGLLIVAGGIGRRITKEAQAPAGRPPVVRGMVPNPLAVAEPKVEVPAVPPDQATVGAIVQRGIGGPLGGVALFILSLGSMAPAVYAASAFGTQFWKAFPALPRRRWTMLGTLIGFPIIALGLPARADLLFGILGAITAPLIGVVVADYLRFRGTLAQATLRSATAAFVAYAAGLVVGLLPACGALLGIPALMGAQPAVIGAFFVSLAIRWYSLILWPGARPVLPSVGGPAEPTPAATPDA